MAVFRIEKTRDYTVMSNHHLKDRTLTLKSKGLLSMMLSLPDEWNYTTRGLAAICREGVDSIGAALKELETHGYMDKDFFQNIPMTQTERITMASRPKQPKYARNKNILVIGGSGSGKTRFFCKPSLLQAHSSYVCTDPKGTLLPEIGAFLERKKYRIKCLNLINFRKSMRYNPLAYARHEVA